MGLDKIGVAAFKKAKNNASAIATLNADDTTEGSVAKSIKDAVDPIEARIDTTELTLARQGQDLASIKQTLQQGNGATLDFSDIGSVALDARATGRANPTVEGLTATNFVENGDFSAGTTWWQGLKATLSVASNVLSVTGDGTSNEVTIRQILPNVFSAGDKVNLLCRVRITNADTLSLVIFIYDGTSVHPIISAVTINTPVPNQWYELYGEGTYPAITPNGATLYIRSIYADSATALGKVMEVDGNYGVSVINLASIFGASNEPSASDCAKIFSYFDGTKSIQLPARVRSAGKNLFDVNKITSGYYVVNGGAPIRNSDAWYSEKIPINSSTGYITSLNGVPQRCSYLSYYNINGTYISGSTPSIATFTTPPAARHVIMSGFSNTKPNQLNLGSTATPYEPYTDSTLYIADNDEVRSIQDVQDTLTMVNGEYIYTKKVSTPASVASGVAVNVTNYPTAKTGGKFAVELTAGGTQIGIIGTDSTSGAGMLRFELDTPVITNLTTSGTLKAFQNGTVYFEPYYEGSHQTDASSQITLPYEGTIDKLTGYDENLEPYEVPPTGYTLVGTTLTITGAEENEVYYVELSRAEPLSPEMSVNVINNEQVIADTENGKFYKLVPTITNGSLIIQTPVEVV